MLLASDVKCLEKIFHKISKHASLYFGSNDSLSHFLAPRKIPYPAIPLLNYSQVIPNKRERVRIIGGGLEMVRYNNNRGLEQLEGGCY